MGKLYKRKNAALGPLPPATYHIWFPNDDELASCFIEFNFVTDTLEEMDKANVPDDAIHRNQYDSGCITWWTIDEVEK